MKDTPGWASPGSAPSGGREPGASGPAGPADRPGPSESADRPALPGQADGTDRQDAAGRPEQSGRPAEPAPGTDTGGPASKWSEQQPPAGQWSAPGGRVPGQVPPPPGPGWGGPPPAAPGGGGNWGGGHGPGGWGGGWGGPPPAAKPGVIPLRPLGIGEILDGAVSTMRTYWRTVLGISLAVAVVTQVAVILLQRFVLADDGSAAVLSDPSATVDELSQAFTDTMLTSGVVLLISLLGTIVATALLTTVTSRAVLGRQVTLGEAWRDARPQLLRLLGLTLLLPVIGLGIVFVGTVPGLLVVAAGGGGGGVALAVLGGLAAAVVATWLLVRFSLASPALMLEKQGIPKSLVRSTKLVRGAWWRVFGIQLLATVIANVVASITVIPFTFLAAALSGEGLSGFVEGSGGAGWTFLIIGGIGSVIGSTLTFPITAGVTVLLYIDQRIRREALDLELARAAGVEEYGTGGPGAPGTTPGS
ncbi:hypothetical protein [Streptomyces minutiscleroticus]|uniref:Membrane protein n=1 Tax=Streptomyces minutiscleroticus TaxID=68238 RepID=A0A918NZ50_9ACTN|nr:hypothetical protein [Streptomyces minutiscleroticus]GGY06213.1 membrane protein [Streptomyces minutiscleroticus]